MIATYHNREYNLLDVVDTCEFVQDLVFSNERLSPFQVALLLPIVECVEPIHNTAGGVDLISALIVSGLATSKRNARELIGGKAVRGNGNEESSNRQLEPGGYILRRGKRDCAFGRVLPDLAEMV